MEKNKFFTLIFSFIPGAGEMYMGMLNKGMFLMGLCCVLIFVGGFINNGAFIIFIPVIWFYSFFETWNITIYNIEQRQNLDIKFTENTSKNINMLISGNLDTPFNLNARTFKKYCGYLLVITGIMFIYKSIIRSLAEIFLYHMERQFNVHYIREFLYSGIPSLFVAGMIIYCGINILKNTNNDTNKKETEFTEYKGDNDKNE